MWDESSQFANPNSSPFSKVKMKLSYYCQQISIYKLGDFRRVALLSWAPCNLPNPSRCYVCLLPHCESSGKIARNKIIECQQKSCDFTAVLMWVTSFANAVPFHLKKISISKRFFFLEGKRWGNNLTYLATWNLVFKIKYKENNLQGCLVILWENVYLETIQRHLKVVLETMVPDKH